MAKILRLKPTRAHAEKAVRTLIAWTPAMIPTEKAFEKLPQRVTRAYEEWFRRYDQDPERKLKLMRPRPKKPGLQF